MRFSLLPLLPCLLPTAAILIRRSCSDYGGPIPKIEMTNDRRRPYLVQTNTFTDVQTAMQRACDIQNNNCFNQANGGNTTFRAADCAKQYQSCLLQKQQGPSAYSTLLTATTIPNVPTQDVILPTGLPVSTLSGSSQALANTNSLTWEGIPTATATPPFPTITSRSVGTIGFTVGPIGTAGAPGAAFTSPPSTTSTPTSTTPVVSTVLVVPTGFPAGTVSSSVVFGTPSAAAPPFPITLNSTRTTSTPRVVFGTPPPFPRARLSTGRRMATRTIFATPPPAPPFPTAVLSSSTSSPSGIIFGTPASRPRGRRHTRTSASGIVFATPPPPFPTAGMASTTSSSASLIFGTPSYISPFPTAGLSSTASSSSSLIFGTPPAGGNGTAATTISAAAARTSPPSTTTTTIAPTDTNLPVSTLIRVGATTSSTSSGRAIRYGTPTPVQPPFPTGNSASSDGADDGDDGDDTESTAGPSATGMGAPRGSAPTLSTILVPNGSLLTTSVVTPGVGPTAPAGSGPSAGPSGRPAVAGGRNCKHKRRSQMLNRAVEV